MIALSPEPIDLNALLAAVRDERLGGIVLFLGAVRRDEDATGRVRALRYELHEPMARQALERIGAELKRFGELRWAIAHRTGELAPGEISVALAVATPHRAEAFAACRYAIDRLKATAPIWKELVYDSGATAWAEGVSL
ncbi:MAG: molybdenum cofactor biosynthesis protein MoaE [bacterium]